MDQNHTREADSRSSNEKISGPLCNQEIHCRVHMSPPSVPLSQMNPTPLSQLSSTVINRPDDGASMHLRNIVLLQGKLMVAQLVTKFTAFYGT